MKVIIYNYAMVSGTVYYDVKNLNFVTQTISGSLEGAIEYCKSKNLDYEISTKKIASLLGNYFIV